jgi:WD40 repeat protein
MPLPRPLRPGDPEVLGDYRLTGLIGEGGQGTVYYGETSTGQPVAVKVLHARFFERADAERRFFNEVAAARRVAEFCTARVIDADITHARPYIVSEFVDGESLDALVRREGPRDPGALDRLAVGTAAALAAVHRAGIVHRDFKPANVLLGADGPRVIDFGIAQVVDAAGTEASRVQGSPAYMSPEQLAGRRPGPPSDVFSWAVTISFAATGRPAFGNDSIPAVMNRIMHREPDLAGVPARLRGVLRACLAKDPAARPTAAKLLMTLVHAKDEAAPPQARSIPRWALGAAAVAVATAGVAIAVPLWPRQPAAVPASVDATVQAAPMSLPTVGPLFGRPLGTPFAGHTSEVLSLATATLGTRPVVVSAGRDGTIRLSDARTGAAAGPARHVDALTVSALALGDLDGRQVLICGGYGTGLWLSDLATGRELTFGAAKGDVLALAMSSREGQPVLVTAGHRAVHVLDLATGRALLALGGGASDVATAELGGRQVIVTAALDGTVHVWDAVTGEPVGTPFAAPGARLALAVVGGRPVVVSGAADNTLRVHDLETGAPVGEPYPGHTDRISAIATTVLDGRPVAVTGSWDGKVRVWDLSSGRPLGPPLAGPGSWVTSVAVTEVDGLPLLLAGSRDGTVRTWRL